MCWANWRRISVRRLLKWWRSYPRRQPERSSGTSCGNRPQRPPTPRQNKIAIPGTFFVLLAYIDARRRVMKRLLPFLLALSASLTWGQTQIGHERRYELRPDANWPLEIELGSGDYQIVASASDSIAVVYDESNADTARKVKVQIDSGHGQNHLKIAGPKSNFHAVVEVPRKTDLRIRMNAGGLSI